MLDVEAPPVMQEPTTLELDPTGKRKMSDEKIHTVKNLVETIEQEYGAGQNARAKGSVRRLIVLLDDRQIDGMNALRLYEALLQDRKMLDARFGEELMAELIFKLGDYPIEARQDRDLAVLVQSIKPYEQTTHQVIRSRRNKGDRKRNKATRWG